LRQKTGNKRLIRQPRAENLFKKRYKGRSLILLLLLFLISITVPVWVTQVSASSSIHQTQHHSLDLTAQGKTLYQAQQFEEAATVWQQAADQFAVEGDPLNQAMALSNLSLTAQQLGQWNQAKSAIAQSLSLLQPLRETPLQQRLFAGALQIQGQLQLALGESTHALQTWQQATAIYTTIGDKNQVRHSQINQAQAMQKLGFYPRACNTLLTALEINHQDCQISEKDLENLSENVSVSLKILGLRSLGNVLRVTGKTQQSQMVLLKSWQFAQTTEKPENLAKIALSLGNTSRALGNEAMTTEQEQQPIDSTESVSCIPAENEQRSDQFYQQAVACYRQAGLGNLSMTQIQAQLNLLGLLIQMQQWAQMPSLIKTLQFELIQTFQNQTILLPTSQEVVAAQLKLAEHLMCLQLILNPQENQIISPILQSCPSLSKTGKTINHLKEIQSLELPSWQAINQLVETAFNQAQQLGDQKAVANALGYGGASAQAMGKLIQAQQLTEAALQRLSAFDNPELVYLWQWQLGRLSQLQGKNNEAITAYSLAVESLESLRQDLVITNADLQFNFRDRVEPVYRELVDLLLHPSANQSGEPSSINPDRLKKARDLIESLQLAQLNNFFQEACLDAEPQSIEQLDSEAAVIYSIILPKRLAVILSLPGNPLTYYETPLNQSSDDLTNGHPQACRPSWNRIPAGKRQCLPHPEFNSGERMTSPEVEQVFDEMFAQLNPYISPSDPLRPHQQFYDWLIRPLEGALAANEIKTLVFVHDSVLRGVPMAALHDGEQYLIEKYNVALTPGLQLLPSRSLSAKELNTLAGGLAEARQGFSPLPGVRKEVEEIAEVVSAQILFNQEFTRPRLQKEIESTPFPVVHLATHGQFSSQAEDTFLLTWDERINVKNLDQLLRERQGQQQTPIELLILSACQTAVGDKRAVLGLAGVAVRSGARSTMATLWSVQDQSTADLVSEFYKTFNQPGVTKAEALRQAQLTLLHSPQYQHPFYWAPFVLVGNWL